MLNGPRHVLPLTIFFIQLFAYLSFIYRAASSVPVRFHRIFRAAVAVCWTWNAILFFFATGNQFSFSSLRAEVAFIGFEEFHFMAGAILLGLKTFAAPLLFSFLLSPVSVGLDASMRLQTREAGLNSLYQMLLGFMFCFSLFATLTTCFVFIARRHLMIWRIFAPKFMFDGLLSIVVNVTCVLIFWSRLLLDVCVCGVGLHGVRRIQ